MPLQTIFNDGKTKKKKFNICFRAYLAFISDLKSTIAQECYNGSWCYPQPHCAGLPYREAWLCWSNPRLGLLLSHWASHPPLDWLALGRSTTSSSLAKERQRQQVDWAISSDDRASFRVSIRHMPLSWARWGTLEVDTLRAGPKINETCYQLPALGVNPNNQDL